MAGQTSMLSGRGRRTMPPARVERRVITLPDGSLMQLNTRTAVDLAFNDQQRLVRLKQGELMITCNSGHPVLVQTRDALLEGFAGRFVAYQDNDCTRVSVSHGKVAIHRPGNGQLQMIGRRPALAPGCSRCAPARAPGHGPDGRTEGLIVTQDMRLSDFLVQVSRYRRGLPGLQRRDCRSAPVGGVPPRRPGATASAAAADAAGKAAPTYTLVGTCRKHDPVRPWRFLAGFQSRSG